MGYETETLRNLDAIKGFGVTGALQRRACGKRQEAYRAGASLDYNLFGIQHAGAAHRSCWAPLMQMAALRLLPVPAVVGAKFSTAR